MKRLQKWSSVCLPVALIVGLVAGWMVVQQVGVTPSEAQMGPGPQMQGPPPKLPPKLHASPAPPPEEMEAQGPPPDQTPRQRPTLQSLLEKIRNQPGGREMIEEAKKRGARIGMRSDEPGTSLSYLNPFKVKVAEASTFSLTLTPGNSYSASPYGKVFFYGALVGGETYTNTTWVRLLNWSSTIAGTQILKPNVYFLFDAPADGWYIVNMEATGARVNLIHYEGGTSSTVGTWSYSGTSGTLSYPALVELTAGYHHFYWISTSSVYVYEADAYSL